LRHYNKSALTYIVLPLVLLYLNNKITTGGGSEAEASALLKAGATSTSLFGV
jgi:hypothetical protein